MNLFAPVKLGDLQLPNRVTMAALTRLRSDESGVPGSLIAEHYAQRASIGLIVTEGTYPSAESRSNPGQPGIVTDAQVEGWRKVADAVHAKGGRIVMQLMNGGRVSHTDINGTDRIVAPSAIAIDGEVRTPTGKVPFQVPHALTAAELAVVTDEFVTAARNAIAAGLDGVELHGANGYLLHQFLAPTSNRREDEFGGSPENRARFVIQVVRAVADAIGAGRVGLRISPMHNIQGVLETDLADATSTYDALTDGIAPLGLAYLSVLHNEPTGALVQGIRTRFGGKIIVNSGFGTVTTRAEAIALVEESHADAVAIGRLAIANPDLLERWEAEEDENEPNPATFYVKGATGYTDYPRLSA